MPAVLLRRDSITDDLTATGYRRVYAGCSAECVQQTSQRFIDGKGGKGWWKQPEPKTVQCPLCPPEPNLQLPHSGKLRRKPVRRGGGLSL